MEGNKMIVKSISDDINSLLKENLLRAQELNGLFKLLNLEIVGDFGEYPVPICDKEAASGLLEEQREKLVELQVQLSLFRDKLTFLGQRLLPSDKYESWVTCNQAKSINSR